MNKRISQIDYLKCIFILLMVTFHLVYVGDKFPYAKQVVYTFHMSAFLVMSGFLANMKKDVQHFGGQIKWLFVPYAIMESGYIIMASVLPIREHIDSLTAEVFLYRLLLHPLGPYWYLHTLIICYLVYYLVNRFLQHLGLISFVCMLGVCYWYVSYFFHIVSFDNAMYFLAGVFVRRLGVGFISIFRPSWLAIIPFLLLCIFSPDAMDRSTLQGFVMTYLAISFILAMYPCLSLKIRHIALFIGENTLSILLFSPIFTIITKSFVNIFVFDNTAILFVIVSVSFVLAGCFAIVWIMDKLHLSRWFCGKEQLMSIPGGSHSYM